MCRGIYHFSNSFEIEAKVIYSFIVSSCIFFVILIVFIHIQLDTAAPSFLETLF